VFHLAELIVVLRRYELKGLIFGAMPQKIPGVRGQSPWGVLERLRKLSDFRIGPIAYLLDGRSSSALLPRKAGGEGSLSAFEGIAFEGIEAFLDIDEG
jgi:hypothetical protein